MNAQTCLQLLREIKDAAFATVDENGIPQVRIIDVMLVEEDALYFCTARGKDFFRQLIQTGQVAITGMNRDFQMIRLHGKVQKLPDQKKWIDRIFQYNPSMNHVYPGESRYILEPFCIATGQIEFFDLGKQPIYRQSLSIGQSCSEKKGFTITDSCIGCGHCSIVCPQHCICEGSPYTIEQSHCLHCGLCAEQCPSLAIKRKREV